MHVNRYKECITDIISTDDGIIGELVHIGYKHLDEITELSIYNTLMYRYICFTKYTKPTNYKRYKYTDTDKIAVLIPCWNKAAYIYTTLLAVTEQTLQPDEVIILLMDDESISMKDKLEALSPIVKCVVHERLNVSAARNYLATLTDANWLCYIDADDIITPDYLQCLLHNDDDSAIRMSATYYYKLFAYISNNFIAKDALINNKASTDDIRGSISYYRTLEKTKDNYPLYMTGTILMHKDVMHDYAWEEDIFSETNANIAEDVYLAACILYDGKYSFGYFDNTVYIHILYTYSSLSMTKNVILYPYYINKFARVLYSMLPEQNADIVYDETGTCLDDIKEMYHDIYTHGNSIKDYIYYYIDIMDVHKQLLIGTPPTVTLVLSYECNKSCSYCGIKSYLNYINEDTDKYFNVKSINMTDEQKQLMYKRIDTIVDGLYSKYKGNVILALSGGEPTLLPYDVQEYIINKIDVFKVKGMYTNGFDKNSPLYKNKNIVKTLHVFDFNSIPEKHTPNILYTYILQHNEIDNMLPLLNKYTAMYNKHANALYWGKCDGDNGISNINADDMIKIIKKNMQDIDINISAEDYLRYSHNLCNKHNIHFNIVLPHMKIKACCCSLITDDFTDYDPEALSFENILKLRTSDCKMCTSHMT